MKRLVAATVAVLGLAFALIWWRLPSHGSDTARHATIPVPLEVQTCEEAKAYPQLVRADDVRFIECDRKDTPEGEAFRLGAPIVIPSTPSSIDAVEYTPERCPNNGGSISTFSIVYRPENIGAAIQCSRQRCDAGDPLGCDDLGYLHSDANMGNAFFPALRPNLVESQAAFRRGCELGYASSCLTLASRFEHMHATEEATRYFRLACLAMVPSSRACLETAERLMAAGRDEEARPYLLRGCRGTSASENPYLFADRQGCAILAHQAKSKGDVASYREYLRLECAFGGSSRTLAACEELGLALLKERNTTKAAAYLRKACGFLPDVQTMQVRSCDALRQIENPNSVSKLPSI
jgi:hypothetical protein